MSPSTPFAPATPAASRIVAGSALVYAVVGWLALLLAIPPGYASPLYPSAGIALAAVVVYGRVALPGVALGAFMVNVVLSASRGQMHAAALVLPAVIGAGAALQAALGAELLRRFAPQPLVLAGPREIARSGLLGALLACLVNPTLATVALRASGAVGGGQVAITWGTWWVGDALGVLIGAPLTLTLIGRPREDWAPRRRTVGVPLLLATLLLAAATMVVDRWDDDRVAAAFERDAERVDSELDSRLRMPLYALQALSSAYLAAGGMNAKGLRDASRWWLAEPLELQAMGFGARVPRSELAAFEAQARADGLPEYHVFDREGASTAGSDVVAIRLIEPREGNAGALGVNALSTAVARAAIERARDSGAAVSSAAFRLTQSANGEAGLVIYQAVYDGSPADLAERRARFRGVVFVTVRAERLLAGLAGPGRPHLQWCLVDRDPATPRPRLAGPPGCENGNVGANGFERRRMLTFASRDLESRVFVPANQTPSRPQVNAWLFSVVGLAAAAMLGALLLTVTGRARRIEVAVDQRTAELRREVDERALAEEALRHSEARLRSILDNVPIGVMFLDLQGRIVETNPHLCEMLGRPAARLLHSTLTEISDPDDHAENRRQLAELLAGHVETSRWQMRLLRGDGQVLWVRAHITVLRDHQRRPLRLAGVAEDITEHLRLEESERALDRAEGANRAKSEFVSRMSHELRTPLNAMIGFAQLLALGRESGLTAQQQDWVAQIQRAGWHLLEMINDTLDLARIESGAVQLALLPLELPALTVAAVSMVAHAAAQRGIVLHEELAPEAPSVLGDETRLKQVLTNLLSNAVKYNRDGGSVVIASRLDADGNVEISVRDSGLGMTPEQMAELFQPYNRLGRENSGTEGTGIGLVISRRLAELMGGTLEAASIAGQGSVFTLRLPRADSAAALPAPQLPSAALPPYRGRLVHYIEDNETNVEVMRGIVAQRPQITLEVSTMGLDGLAAIRQRRPDLVLLDMQLPDISGLELLRHLKNDDEVAGIPVVVVSADATTARMQEALTLGAAHYVTKPVDIASFLRTLDEVLEAVETRWSA
jgi:PAS domain S-box-containing protein